VCITLPGLSAPACVCCLSGVTGIALALAGASVLLTDLPHILPLTQENVAGNCRPAVHKAHVAEYQWGTDATSMLQQVVGTCSGV